MKAALVLLLFCLASLGLRAAEGLLLPDTPLKPGVTQYWSPGMTLCWSGLDERMDFTLTNPADAPALQKLDRLRFDAETLYPEGSLYAFCGPATQESQNTINQALEKQFGEDIQPVEMPEFDPQKLYALSYLKHRFEYSQRFFRSRKSGLVFHCGDAKKTVAFFGIRGELTEKYDFIRVLDYDAAAKRHSLEIPGKRAGESIVLMQDSELTSFNAAIQRTQELREANSTSNEPITSVNHPQIHEADEIRIPFCRFDCKTDFLPDLKPAILTSPNSKLPWHITHARERARFELDEFGAKVEVISDIMGGHFGEPPKPVPRRFTFDRPFFVSLWRANAGHPYFIARIADPEDLERFESPAEATAP